MGGTANNVNANQAELQDKNVLVQASLEKSRLDKINMCSMYLCVSVHVFSGDDLQQRLCHSHHGHT